VRSPGDRGAAPAGRRRSSFFLVLVLYLALGTLYAARTPPWQVPDEPAHFTYVQHLAEHPFDLPQIEPGDYPFEKVETIKAGRWSWKEWMHYGSQDHRPAMPVASVDDIQYEDHQPPAYYLAASWLWRYCCVVNVPRSPIALRLLGVLLGAITVWAAWRVAGLLYPEDGTLAAATAAFVAFLPMHLAMTAAVNNDPLAYAVMGIVLVVAVRRVTGRIGRRGFAWGGGALLGLAILTKVSAAAPALAVLVAAEAICWWRRGRFGTMMAASTAWQAVGLGLLIGLPWMVRNTRVYGAGDWFGLRAHDLAVACPPAGGACQPRTADWIAERGLADLLARFGELTFKSFWGVFGWMAVFLTDVRGIPIYGALAAVTLLAATGLALHLARLARDPAADGSDQRWGLVLLGVSFAVTLAGYLWYNLTFVQHQGRYLFPALIPIALAFMLGLREVARRAAALARLGGAWTARLEAATLYGFAAALAALAWISLTRFIVPGLGRGG